MLLGIALSLLCFGIGCGDFCLFCDGDQDVCDPDPCASKDNATADTCADLGGNDYTCDCDDEYFWKDDGNTCENPCDPDPCASKENATAGTCTGVSADDYTCECESGFVWDEGSKTCVEDPCDPDPCAGIADAEPGSCVPQGEDEFTCQCGEGFFWDGTDIACKDPCASAPCDTIANAVEGSCEAVDADNFTCECDPNYTWDPGTNSCSADPVGTCEDLKDCLLACNGFEDSACQDSCYETWTGCDCELDFVSLATSCDSLCLDDCPILNPFTKACWDCVIDCGFDTQCQ